MDKKEIIDKKEVALPPTAIVSEATGPPDTITDKGLHGDRPRRRDDDEHDKRGGEEREGEGFTPPGATSFAELDEIEAAQEAANDVRRRTGQFNGLIDNIMIDPDVEDKAAAISDLATEFGVMAGAAMERKERWQPLTDAVVNAIAPLIDKIKGEKKFKDAEFKCGCESCGYGTKELLKEVGDCPFCFN